LRGPNLKALGTLANESETTPKCDILHEWPEFPGSRSQFTTQLKFIDPSSYPTIPVFRILDQNGQLVSNDYSGLLNLELAKRFHTGLQASVANMFPNFVCI